MNTEIEERVLEIDKDKVIAKLEELGAKKIGDWHQKRYVYDFIPKRENEWIRLRTNGKETTLTYKNIESKDISGTKELEIVVSDFEETNQLLKIMGYTPRSFQENLRTRYYLDHIEIDIDTWPLIPTYLEIEGNSEEGVKRIEKLLELNESKVTTMNCQDIYLEEYGIDINQIEELKFDENENDSKPEVIKL